MSARIRSRGRSASVEYVGALLLVALLFGAFLTLTGLARPAAGLLEAIAARMICAVRLAEHCRPPASPLQLAYGPELAALIAAQAPELRFEDGDFVSLPVDPRECRSRACADSSERGILGRSFEDLAPTAFVHVVDCRPGADPGAAECSGARAGSLYLQYWLYYPDSATRPFSRLGGFHKDDWESVQVRVERTGEASARASSHHGYNYDADFRLRPRAPRRRAGLRRCARAGLGSGPGFGLGFGGIARGPGRR